MIINDSGDTAGRNSIKETLNNNESEIESVGRTFESKHPTDVIRWLAREFPIGSVAMATGFGAEGVILIDMIVKTDRNIPIFFLDTGVLFPETYELRLRIEERYGIRLIRYASETSLNEQARLQGDGLWETNPDLCCRIRKVDPLRNALKNYSGWITAIRREQAPSRAKAGVVEWDKKFNMLKINPLATWKKRDVWRYITDHDISYNPLYDHGYASIGCTHCTTPVSAGEDERAGRWRGFAKKECGLHV